MKKYLLYELKKNAFAIGCLTLIAVIIYASPLLALNIHNTYPGFDTSLGVISTIGGVLAACVPVWILSYKMKKRSLDLYFALPLSRTKILAVKLITGLIAVFVPYTVAYWAGALIYIAKFVKYINAVYYVPQYFASCAAIYFIYAMASFAFTRANKLLDGIIFIIFWALAAYVAVIVLFELTTPNQGVAAPSIFFYENYYTPYAPLDWVTTQFMKLIRKSPYEDNYSTTQIISLALGFGITFLLAAGSTAGLFITEKRFKAENAEQISESRFGYKTMIPFYTATLGVTCNLIDSFGNGIEGLLGIAGMFLLTVLYKRTIKLDKKQLIIFGVSVAAAIILSVIAYI